MHNLTIALAACFLASLVAAYPPIDLAGDLLRQPIGKSVKQPRENESVNRVKRMANDEEGEGSRIPGIPQVIIEPNGTMAINADSMRRRVVKRETDATNETDIDEEEMA